MRLELPKAVHSPPVTFAISAIASVLAAAAISGSVDYRTTADFLYRWQTLIAGIVALAGALLTVWQMRAHAAADDRAAMQTFERILEQSLDGIDVAWEALDYGMQQAPVTELPLGNFRRAWALAMKQISWELLEQSAAANRFLARVKCEEFIQQLRLYVDAINQAKAGKFGEQEIDDDEAAGLIRLSLSHIDRVLKTLNPKLGRIFADRQKARVLSVTLNQMSRDYLVRAKPRQSLRDRMRQVRREQSEANSTGNPQAPA